MIYFFEKSKFLAFVKYFPAYLVFLGCLKLIVFYKSFDIKIVEYLDSSEVLISFLDSVIFYFSIFVFPILLLLSFFGNTIGKVNAESFNKSLNLKFYLRLLNDFKEYYIAFILGLINIIIFLFVGKMNEAKIALFVIFPGIYIVFFIVRELRIAYKKQYNYSIPATYVNIFIILFMMTSFILRDTLNDVHKIKQQFKYFGSEVQFDNEKIKSDSIITYIGQTRNYIFFYNLKINTSIIYPKTRIVSIKLIQNN